MNHSVVLFTTGQTDELENGPQRPSASQLLCTAGEGGYKSEGVGVTSHGGDISEGWPVREG